MTPIVDKDDAGTWIRVELSERMIVARVRLEIDCGCWRHLGIAHGIDLVTTVGGRTYVRAADSDPALPFRPADRVGPLDIRSAH